MNSWLIRGSKNLIRRRYHLLPTLLAVSIGMMLVTIVGGIGEIGFAMVEEEISGLGVGSVTITANKTIADVPLTEEKLTVLREAPGVESASPVVMLFTPVRLKGEVTQSAVWGTDMGSDQVVELSLLYGRLLVEADITERRPVCVIDENLAQEIYGRSNIVGLPVSKLLLDENATVTIAHSRTANLPELTRQAEILVVAIGRPKFVTADMVSEGTVVIDVGVNRDPQTGKLCGDVDFAGVEPKAAVITPVPGGVGPMTICCLMENTIECFLRRMSDGLRQD